MQNKIKLALIAALSLLLFSCGDDNGSNPKPAPTPSGDTPDYFNMRGGDYYVYNFYTIEDDGSEKFSRIDSTYIGSEANWMGKDAFPVNDFIFNDNENTFIPNGLHYRYSTGKELYFSGNYIGGAFAGLIGMYGSTAIHHTSALNKVWAKVMDLNNDSYQILPKDFEIRDKEISPAFMEDVPADPGTITMDADCNVDVQKLPNSEYTDPITNKKLKAVSVKLTFKIKTKVKFSNPVGGLKELPLDNPVIKYERTLTFAEGIGLVKEYVPDQKVSLTATIAGVNVKVTKYDIGGYVKKLLRYKKDK